MTQEEYRTATDEVIYLAACAVNGTVPDKDRVAEMNLDRVFAIAERHMIAAAVGMALYSVGIRDHRFIQVVSKAQRKNALLDADRLAMCARLEQAGIWYAPLKGAVLKELYPQYGMREMADNDILIDPERAEDVKTVMESLGFSTIHFGGGCHDIYRKPPVINFEVHTALFSPGHGEKVYRYYRDVKNRLVKDEENGYGYHFTAEDLYIYMTVHEHKHYANSGTGLRSLLDVYVFLKKNGLSLDFSYIEAEIEKLGIEAFEQQNRSLAMKLFRGDSLTDEDKEMLEYVTRSGAYGIVSYHVENSIQKLGGGTKGKLRYFFRRMFPPMEAIRIYYPIVYKYKILVPFLFLYRLGKGLLHHRSRIRSELRALMKKRIQRSGGSS